MFIFYVLLIAYILAVNFYAFLLVKTLRDKEIQSENSLEETNPSTPTEKPTQKYFGKLFTTGILGGAITIYVCMFLLKYKRSELLLMVGMPLLGVLNVYFWVLLFRSGFSFFMIR